MLHVLHVAGMLAQRQSNKCRTCSNNLELRLAPAAGPYTCEGGSLR